MLERAGRERHRPAGLRHSPPRLPPPSPLCDLVSALGRRSRGKGRRRCLLGLPPSAPTRAHPSEPATLASRPVSLPRHELTAAWRAGRRAPSAPVALTGTGLPPRRQAALLGRHCYPSRDQLGASVPGSLAAGQPSWRPGAAVQPPAAPLQYYTAAGRRRNPTTLLYPVLPTRAKDGTTTARGQHAATVASPTLWPLLKVHCPEQGNLADHAPTPRQPPLELQSLLGSLRGNTGRVYQALIALQCSLRRSSAALRLSAPVSSPSVSSPPVRRRAPAPS